MSYRDIPASFKFSCLICEKELHFDENVYPRIDGPICDGVSICTSGNYGSKALDGESAYFAICDECFVKKAKHMMIYDPYDGYKKNLPAENITLQSGLTFYQNWSQK